MKNLWSESPFFVTGFFIVALVICVWLIVAFYNYRRAIRLVEDYIERRNKYKEIESKSLTPESRAQAFTARVNMSYDYNAVGQLAELYEKDKEGTLKTLRRVYFKLGFTYNLFN